MIEPIELQKKKEESIAAISAADETKENKQLAEKSYPAKGQIISGKFSEIIARQKSGEDFELGELMIAESEGQKTFLQVYDIQYGSQISQQNLELISGMHLEEDDDLEFMDKSLRTYRLAYLKSLIQVQGSKVNMSKNLPQIFSKVREVRKDDLSFLSKPAHALFFGNLRSGSKALDVPIYLDGEQVLTHHILISGTTGKGKSVLMSNLLWDSTGKDYNALLVLDPHDEYYGRNNNGKIGLKDHPSKNVIYYTPKNPPAGARTLKINIKILRPNHFGCLDFSDAQEQAMNAYYREYGTKWIEAILLETIGTQYRQNGKLEITQPMLENHFSSRKEAGAFINGLVSALDLLGYGAEVMTKKEDTKTKSVSYILNIAPSSIAYLLNEDAKSAQELAEKRLRLGTGYVCSGADVAVKKLNNSYEFIDMHKGMEISKVQ